MPTPSTTASPPPRQPPFTSQTSVRGDGPSPAKRRRIATPNSEPTAFSSSSTPSVELEAERRAASLRVLNIWSGLASKYARRIDEDDIIDLRTGNLVRDRGVLSSTSRPWAIGHFADVTDGESLDYQSDESEDEDEDEDEDDDELGGWGSGSEVGHQFTAAHLPPVQELDPEDARDLKEFLVAEEARKMEHGDDSDFDSVVDVEAGSALALSDEESPDELDGYDETVGEGAILYELSPPERLLTPVQLRTPPSSRSSETTPATRFTTPSRRFLPEVVVPPRQNIKVSSPQMARHSYPPHAQQSPPPIPQTYGYENQLNASQMHLNPQIIIAQAMQSLSYLAYSIVGQQFPDWTNPMMPSPVPPCPPPCTPTKNPPPRPRPSSAHSFKDDSDSSFNSSPLYGRRKGKGRDRRVSFPDEDRERVPPCPPPSTPTTYPPPRPPPSSARSFKDDSDCSFNSFPLYDRRKGKGKGKRVSFPDEHRER